MKIYVSHSRSFDFIKELYEPLKALLTEHRFIFPHELSQEAFPSKQLFLDKACDLVLAEVSFPSTGQGIELGWADLENIKIICMSREGLKISGSLMVVSKDILFYKNTKDLINQLQPYLNL